MLGLRCHVQAFSTTMSRAALRCGARGLIAAVSLVQHGLQARAAMAHALGANSAALKQIALWHMESFGTRGLPRHGSLGLARILAQCTTRKVRCYHLTVTQFTGMMYSHSFVQPSISISRTLKSSQTEFCTHCIKNSSPFPQPPVTQLHFISETAASKYLR